MEDEDTSKVCQCHAFEPNECCCGAWDDVADWWYADEYVEEEDNEE